MSANENETIADIAAAMRKALEKADAALTLITQSALFFHADIEETIEIMEAVEAVHTALSAPIKNWERFEDWSEAWQYYDTNLVPALTRMEWGRGAWMYMDYIEGESRLDFLRRCNVANHGSSILTAAGSKELKKLEKAAAKDTSTTPRAAVAESEGVK